MSSRFRTALPVLTLFGVVLAASASETAQRYVGPGSQTQGQTASRGTTPPPQGQTVAPATAKPGAPAAARGQQPRSAELFLTRSDTPWWKDAAIQKEVVLQPRQVRDITWIVETRTHQIAAYYDEYLKQLADLDRMTVERLVDDAVYAVQVNRVESLRSKLNETRTVMLYQIYRKLSAEQYKKLGEIRDRNRTGRGGAPAPRTW